MSRKNESVAVADRGTLYRRAISEVALRAAWERTKEAVGSDTPGPDRETATKVGPKLDAWLAALGRELRDGTFAFSAPRSVEIPKPGKPGKFCTLGIPNLRERVVANAIKGVMEPVWEAKFDDRSFGFRPGRSVPSAMRRVLGVLAGEAGRPHRFAVHLDVADCFGTIDHGHLWEALRSGMPDRSLDGLLGGFARSASKRVGWWWGRRNVGLVQGSPLSPLLCNVALHPLDGLDLGGAVSFRYADDLLVIGRSAWRVRRAARRVSDQLKRWGQHLGELRRPVPLTEGVDWLGLLIRERPGSGRGGYGCLIPEGKVERMRERVRELTEVPSDRLGPEAFRAVGWIAAWNEQVSEWIASYRFADNSKEVFAELNELSYQRFGRLIPALTGVRGNERYRRFAAKSAGGDPTWRIDSRQLHRLPT